jgi:hypothetical protein
MSVFEQGHDTVGKVATFMVCGWFLLESAKDQFLGVNPPPPNNLCHKCLVWNNLLTNSDCFRECALLGGGAMGTAIPVNRMVQEGPLSKTLGRQVILSRVNLCKGM